MDIGKKQRILQKLFDNSERCLIEPENPFSMDNPDAIVANGNKLFAIYIPTYRENENADHLLRRLYLSQLSYGYKLTPIIVVMEEMAMRMIYNSPIIAQTFGYISESTDDVVNIVNQANPRKRRSKYFSEMQAMQYLTYRQNIELSERSRKEMRTEFSTQELRKVEPVITRSWSTEKEKESRLYWKSEVCFVASVEKKKNASFRTSFEQLMTTAFMSKFQLDNGEIFPTGMYNELSVLNTDWNMFDEESVPNMYNRMLSYVGLPPISISTERELTQVFECYQKIRNNVVG